jgi:hypothetical protein
MNWETFHLWLESPRYGNIIEYVFLNYSTCASLICGIDMQNMLENMNGYERIVSRGKESLLFLLMVLHFGEFVSRTVNAGYRLTAVSRGKAQEDQKEQ